MKKLFFLILFLAISLTFYAQPAPESYKYDLNYFVPKSVHSYNKEIPTPKSILGYEIGEQYADWNDIVKYMNALSSVSSRVSIKEFGKSYQHRSFIQVIITSPSNQARLEKIKKEHLDLTDVEKSDTLDIGKMPVFVNIISSIHGNEASGVNASLVVAYFFAACEDSNVKELLDKTVLILTPGQNPDGINRFASWVNTTRSFDNVADLNSREFTEPWPSSRTNHYWADCNRDWLMTQHPEGINAVDMYMEWLPNVVSDLHEQGGDGKGYYFSPGNPLRTNKMTPEKNQELTCDITKRISETFDTIGTLYYSKEGYDDFYYGKGASYGDMHGSVAFLCEQVASRSFLRPTSLGEMSFPSTVRNQSFSAITTVFAAYQLKNELLDYQKEYYKETKKAAASDKIKGYVFNTRGNHAIEFHFLQSMQHHRIDVYKLQKDITIKSTTFSSDDSYIVPTDQKYYTKVRTIWENATEFQDSTFYDISTWTFPHAYNLEYSPVTSISGLKGEKVEKVSFHEGEVVGGKSNYAYVFNNKEYYIPKMITSLLRDGIIVRVGTKPFSRTLNGEKQVFGYGTIVIPVKNQSVDADLLYDKVLSLAKECGVTVHSFSSGLMNEFDLGSPSFKGLRMPQVAIIVGRGMGIPQSGEIWHMLDYRFQMHPVLIEYTSLGSVDLKKYNVIILANGDPTEQISESVLNKLHRWVSEGGVMVVEGKSYRLTNKAKITNIELLPKAKISKEGGTPVYKSFISGAYANTGNNVDGVILNCRLDETNPLGWGYDGQNVAVIKESASVYKAPANQYAVPMSYLEKPYLSGCISEKNLNRIGGTPAIITDQCGKGNVIFIADDLNFRSYWFGTGRLFMNAILYGTML